MKRNISCVVLCLLAEIVSRPASADVKFDRVAVDVYVALQDQDHPYDDANVTVVVGRDAAVIIDAPADAVRTRAIADAVKRMAKSPVRYIINTHWHSDHTQGNQIYRDVFGSGLRIIGHQTLVEDVPNRAAKYVSDRVERLRRDVPMVEKQLADGVKKNGEPMTDAEKASLRAAVERAREWMTANQDVVFLVPDLPYEGSKELDLGGVVIRLQHFRAHTRGDTVVMIPERKIAVTGDIVDALPYAGHGYLRDWVNTLDILGETNAEIFIPGHGPVFHGRDQLRLDREYLAALVAQTEAAVNAGKDLEATKESVDLSSFRTRFANGDPGTERFFDAVLDEAVERGWLEARGEAE